MTAVPNIPVKFIQINFEIETIVVGNNTVVTVNVYTIKVRKRVFL